MARSMVSALLFVLLLNVLNFNGSNAQLVLVGANNAANTPGGQRFDSVLGIGGAFKILGDAVNFVRSQLRYGNSGVPSKDITKVTFTVDDMDGVAFTRGGQSSKESEIHLSARYVGNYNGDVVTEIRGVLYHEMVHVWQWNAKGTAPGGLIEGIADFVRLKAGLAPSHWVKPGQGNKWDQGYDVTARFLDYCTSLDGAFVWKLNAWMATNTWNENIFKQLLGKTVGELWNSYKNLS